MLIEAGKKIGRYEVLKKLGEGGMGEVFLAYDISLERRVALKILSEEFSRNEQRVLRFKQEAKAASALNHPNIITIYEIGKVEDVEFIATEFIEGDTLREKITRNELSLPESLKIAEQIADGLCAAHEAHIVHRDIKPENVIVRRDGYVKILDFGLAKPTLMRKTGAEDETVEMVKTAPGVVMGSVRYMSPEQARGKVLDDRTDLWSLGIVLYEMVAGNAPFDGETVSDTLANLIHLEPKPLFEVLPDVPDELQRIARKSLQKNRDERYQTARDFALDLKTLRREMELHQTEGQSRRLYPSSDSLSPRLSGENITQSYPKGDLPKATTKENITQTQFTAEQHSALIAQKSSNRVWRNAFIGFASLAFLASLAFFSAKLFSDSTLKTSAFQNPQISRLSDDGKSRLPAISPDGRYIAFQSGELGAQNIMVRQLATGSAVEIVPKSGFKTISISFSPDGNYVWYVQGDRGNNINSLYQVPTLGGASKKIVEDVDSNISFSPAGKRLAFIRHLANEGADSLYSVNIDGTDEKLILNTAQTEFGFFSSPAWSPDGEKIALIVGDSAGGKTTLVTLAEVSVKDSKLNLLSNGKWSSISDISWQKKGSGFFALGCEKENDPIQVWSITYPAGERKRLTNDTNSYIWLGISGDNKTLVTLKSDSSSSIWSFSLTTKDLKQITPENRNASGDSGITPISNGNLLITRYTGAELNLWEITVDGKDVRQLTSDASLNASPKISPDGTKIVFMSNRSGAWRVWKMDFDGKNAKQLTIVDESVNQFNPHFSNDGSIIFFSQQEKNSGRGKILKVSIEGGTPEPVLPPNDDWEEGGYASPDGKYLALIAFNPVNKKFIRIFGLDKNTPTKSEYEFESGLMYGFEWSPGGKSLIYINQAGVPNIWQMSLDGKQRKPLTNFTAGRIADFAWSKDGGRLFIVRRTVNNDLVLIKD